MLVSVACYFLPLEISNEAKIVLSILVFSGILWATETIPLFMTSLIASILIVLFRIFKFNEALVKFFDPTLVLLFGGFLIARSMQDVGLDRIIAKQITSRVKNDKRALLALMFVTAFLSLWISNTATTLVMIPIALGIVAKFRRHMTNFSKAAVLGVAYSANIGGVGTILGSPPNALTVSKLMEISSIEVSFLEWMKMALPLVVILIPVAWLLLIEIFPFESVKLKDNPKLRRLSIEQRHFLYVFGITILLWVTTDLHGLSSDLIAIMSATTLFLIGLLRIEDLNRINYNVLILFGGGLVLGSAMFSSGLSAYFADAIANVLRNYPGFIVLLGVAAFSIALGAFASNTATAAIIVPVILPLASILSFSPKILSILAGIAVSFDFLLPVGTPPNAIAYASGKISIKDMLKAGILLTIASILLLVLAARFLWT